MQCLQVLAGEASAEVAGGGGVGDAASAQGIEEDLIVSEQFQVLQASASAEGQIGQGEDRVGLVVGQVKPEQLESSVDSLGESEPTGESVDGSDAADGESARALGNLLAPNDIFKNSQISPNWTTIKKAEKSGVSWCSTPEKRSRVRKPRFFRHTGPC